jgi:hypothetical protein
VAAPPPRGAASSPQAASTPATREGNLQLSLHLFNTPDEIDQALDAPHAPLKSAG